MSGQPRELHRRPAARPAPRTVEVTLGPGPFEGWWARMRADFPARVVEDFESGKVPRIIAALDAVIIEHNMPGSDGELAPSLADVDPWDGLAAVAVALTDELQKLPPR